MRTMILSGMILAATMSGCATMGKVGANTTNYRVWWKDCGVSRDVPGNLEVFKGQTPSPNTALATAEQLPSPKSNVKGVMRVILPHAECNGQGVEVADLIPDTVTDITPAATAPKVYRFKVAPVDPSRWGE